MFIKGGTGTVDGVSMFKSKQKYAKGKEILWLAWEALQISRNLVEAVIFKGRYAKGSLYSMSDLAKSVKLR